VLPLIAALKDEDSKVRERAAIALGHIGDSRALPELERLAREDQGKTSWGMKVKDVATRAIEEIKRKQAGSNGE
jgi:HEAT repeat protein